MAEASDLKRLRIFGIPAIQTLDDFSFYTHLSKYSIYQFSVNAEFHYRVFEIEKKNGKKRRISHPSRGLKGLQSWILSEILGRLRPSENCKGFERHANLCDNAVPHSRSNVVMTLDLVDFFPSVPSRRVYRIFRSIGYSELIATVLTRICTLNEGLPQGAPTSPKLANLVLWPLDLRIQGYVGKRGIVYTRYADDLTFSGNNPKKLLWSLPTLRRIIREEGFELNIDKTRIAGPARAKIVTGLVLTGDAVGIGRKSYRLLRAKIYRLLTQENQNDLELLEHVRGWLSYLRSVDRIRFLRAEKYIATLAREYPSPAAQSLSKNSKFRNLTDRTH